jgi:hypothetical protein
MFGGHFYHATMRKSVAVFGTLFNNINVIRKAADGGVLNQIKVPLSYGPKEKFLSRLDQESGYKQSVALKLPRLGFEITDLAVDSNQKLNKLNRIIEDHGSDTTKRKSINNYTSYDIGMSLYILAKSQDDGLQIVEQILPYFTPDYTVSIKPVDNFAFTQDVPVILNSVNIQDDYEGDYASRRVLIYQLDFTMKMKFYGPTGDRPIIREVDVDIIDLRQFEDAVADAIANGTSILNPKTYNYSIVNSDGNGNYIFDSSNLDRNGTIAQAGDPTLNIYTGDTITIINELAPSHPLQIESSNGDVLSSDADGVTSFTFTNKGFYYYQCTSHAAMRGQITVTDNVARFDVDPNTAAILEEITTTAGTSDVANQASSTTDATTTIDSTDGTDNAASGTGGGY